MSLSFALSVSNDTAHSVSASLPLSRSRAVLTEGSFNVPRRLHCSVWRFQRSACVSVMQKQHVDLPVSIPSISSRRASLSFPPLLPPPRRWQVSPTARHLDPRAPPCCSPWTTVRPPGPPLEAVPCGFKNSALSPRSNIVQLAVSKFQIYPACLAGRKRVSDLQ